MKTKFLLLRRKSFPLLNVGLLIVLFCMNLQGQITQVGTAATASSGDWGSTTLTISKPNGISVGDIMIANISQATDWQITPTVPAGTPTSDNWTQIATNNSAFNNIARGTILYKIANATDADPATISYTFTLGVNHKAAGAIAAFTGINKDNPFIAQDIGLMQITATSNNITCPGITTSADNAMVIMFATDWALCGLRDFNSWATAINPNSLTENYDYNSVVSPLVHVGAAWAIKENAGPTGTGTLSNTNCSDIASYKTTAILLALRPEKSVSITGPTSICAVNGTTTLIPTSGGTWESSNPSVALVTNAGDVTGLAAGTASFTFTADGGTWSATTGAVTVNPSFIPSVTIVSDLPGNKKCETQQYLPVKFTANTSNTGGGTVNYQWYWEGIPLSDWDVNNTWESSELDDGEKVSCMIKVTGTCLTSTTATSNEITTRVYPDVQPTVRIESDPGTEICDWANVTFTAIPENTNGGEVSYLWYRNDDPGVSYDQKTLSNNGESHNGDRVSCTIKVTNGACFGTATASSDEITITVNPDGGTATTTTPTICPGKTAVITLTDYFGSIQWQYSDGSSDPIDVIGGTGSTTNVYTTPPLTEDTYFFAKVTGGTCPPTYSYPVFITVACNCTDATLVLASAAGTNIQTVCENTAITPIVYTAGGGATGVGVTGLPDGVSGNFSNGTFTISGTPTIEGEFTFIVATTGTISPCTEATATGTITVDPPTVAGSITGGTPICSGSTSGLLTLGAHTGAVVRWESSVSPFEICTPIVNTADTYTSGALTATTQFRAVVKSGDCAEKNSVATTVTVKPQPTLAGISIDPSVVCIGEGVATLTISGLLNGENTINIDFTFPGMALTGIEEKVTPTGGTYSIPYNLWAAGAYSIKINSIKVDDCTTGFTTNNYASWTVLPNAALTSVSGVDQLCIGAKSTFTADGAVLGGGTGIWSSSNTAFATVDQFGEVTAVAAGTCDINYTISGGCNKTGDLVQSKSLTINPIPTLTGVTVSTHGVCVGSSVDFTASGLRDGLTQFNYTITYDDNVEGTPLVITNETIAEEVTGGVATFTIDAPTAGGYELKITSATINGCTTNFGYNNSHDYFAVEPQPSVTIFGETSVCSDSETVLEALTKGGVGIQNIKWEYKNGDDWVFISQSDENFQLYVTPNGTITYRAIYSASGNGCTSAISDEFTRTVVSLPTVNIASSAPDNKICDGTEVTFTATPSNTNGGTVSYQWVNNGSSIGNNNNTYASDKLKEGDVVSCMITVTGGPCITSENASSNEIKISVEGKPVAGTLAITPDYFTVCEETPVSATLIPGSGGNGTDELQFRTNDGTNWSVWAPYTSGTDISTTDRTGIEIRTQRLATLCSNSEYNIVSWTVEAIPIIDNPVPQTANGSYPLPAITGMNLVNAKYYNNSQAAGGTVITGPITTSMTVWIFDASTSGCKDEESFLVSINALPATPVVGVITQPTCSAPTGSVVLSGLPSGSWTLKRMPGSVTTSGSTPSTIISALPFGNTYNFTVTNSVGGTSSPSGNVVVNLLALPPAPVIGTITQPTCSLATGSVALSGLPSPGEWTVTGTGGTSTVTKKGKKLSENINGLTAGTTYTFTVTNRAGCISLPSGDVVINPQPVIPGTPAIGSQNFCGSATEADLPQGNGINTYNWYLESSKGEPLAGNTTLNTRNYYVSQSYGGCESSRSMVRITINNLPQAYKVEGGGNYCTGGPGLKVKLTDSALGVNYQLYLNDLPVAGAILPGTGSALYFINQTLEGTYTIKAVNAITGCEANMNDKAVIKVSEIPTASTIIYDKSSSSNCKNSGSASILIFSCTPGGKYSSAPSGLNISSSTGTINLSKSDPGTYTVTYTVSNTCGTAKTTTTVTVTKCETKNGVVADTGEEVQDIIPEADEINVFPNPSNGFVTFEFSTKLDGKVTIDLFSMQGKLIWNIFEGEVHAGELRTIIFNEVIPTGTYIYRMNTAYGIKTGKLIIIQ